MALPAGVLCVSTEGPCFAEWEQHPSSDWTQLPFLWSCRQCVWGAQKEGKFKTEIWRRWAAPEAGVRDAKVLFWVLDWKVIFLCSLYKAWEVLSSMKHQICWAKFWKVVDKSYITLVCSVRVLVLFAMSCSCSQCCCFICFLLVSCW